MNKELIIEWVIFRLAGIPVSLILTVISIIGLAIGTFMAVNPGLSIEIQRRFYSHINWRIEPISFSKEIRNTRAMGWFLVILSVTTLSFILTKTLFQT